jgi:hypothetical protein
MRQLLAAIHPGLEQALDLTAKAPLALVTRFVTPGEIGAAAPSWPCTAMIRRANQRSRRVGGAGGSAARTIVGSRHDHHPGAAAPSSWRVRSTASGTACKQPNGRAA